MYKKFHMYATFAICIPIHRGLYKQDTDPFEAGVLFVIFRFSLFPLDCCVRLRREVVAYAVYSRDLSKDPVCDLHEDRPLDLLD